MVFCRYFSYYDKNTDQKYGRYQASNPKQAASKCARKRIQYLKSIGQPININQEFTLAIKEMTRGSQKKIYFYSAKMIKYTHPIHVSIGSGAFSKTIVFQYKLKLKKLSQEKLTKVKTIDVNENQNEQITDLEPKNILEIDNNNLVIEI